MWPTLSKTQCAPFIDKTLLSKQGVALTGRNTTGPPRAAPWWVTYLRCAVECYRRTASNTIQAPYTVCRRASTKPASGSRLNDRRRRDVRSFKSRWWIKDKWRQWSTYFAWSMSLLRVPFSVGWGHRNGMNRVIKVVPLVPKSPMVEDSADPELT